MAKKAKPHIVAAPTAASVAASIANVKPPKPVLTGSARLAERIDASLKMHERGRPIIGETQPEEVLMSFKAKKVYETSIDKMSYLERHKAARLSIIQDYLDDKVPETFTKEEFMSAAKEYLSEEKLKEFDEGYDKLFNPEKAAADEAAKAGPEDEDDEEDEDDDCEDGGCGCGDEDCDEDDEDA